MKKLILLSLSLVFLSVGANAANLSDNPVGEKLSKECSATLKGEFREAGELNRLIKDEEAKDNSGTRVISA